MKRTQHENKCFKQPEKTIELRNVGSPLVSSSSNQNEPVKVILDSNALFVPLEMKIDIFEETRNLLMRNVDFVLLSPIKEELECLASNKSNKTRKEALFALKLSEKCRFVAVDNPDKLSTDDLLAKVAKAWNSPVFTNDRQLRNKLKDISVPVIYVRQKSRLDIDGLI